MGKVKLKSGEKDSKKKVIMEVYDSVVAVDTSKEESVLDKKRKKIMTDITSVILKGSEKIK